MNAEAVRDEKLKVLRSLKPIDTSNVEKLTVRGQYRAGASRVARSRVIWKSWKAAFPTPKPSSPSRPKSPTGAGPAFPSTSAPANASRPAFRKSSSPSSRSRIRSSTMRPARSRPTSWSFACSRMGRQAVSAHQGPRPGGMRLRQVSLDMSFAEAFNVRSPDAYERLLRTRSAPTRRCSCGATRLRPPGTGSTRS